MKTTLVIMAAGLASRYGGNKQTEGIGPNHEMLMEYSLFDAIRAGFNKFIFVIKPDMRQLIETLCGELLSQHPHLDVHYAVQDYTTIPSFYQVPAERIKPFGTVHAVLCAARFINEPFAVINADDYYGVDGYASMYDYLRNIPSGEAAMIGYYLKNTVSESGAVTRGICSASGDMLSAVTETYKILPFPDGTIRDTASSDEGVLLNPHSLVSMNFWGFNLDIIPSMNRYFEEFLKSIKNGDTKAECLLPVMIDSFMKKDTLNVRILSTNAVWFGMTYSQDRPYVQQALKSLHDKGIYPTTLIGKQQ